MKVRRTVFSGAVQKLAAELNLPPQRARELEDAPIEEYKDVMDLVLTEAEKISDPMKRLQYVEKARSSAEESALSSLTSMLELQERTAEPTTT
jgi:hypothetical protein